MSGLGLAEAEVFLSWGFFFAVVNAAFRGLVEGVERRADFLAGLDAGLVFGFGMGKPLSRFTRDLGRVGGPDGDRGKFRGLTRMSIKHMSLTPVPDLDRTT